MHLLFVLALVSASGTYVLAAASPLDSVRLRDTSALEHRQLGGPSLPASMCATEILCCNSVTYASDPSAAQLLALLGINVAGTYPVGLVCSPIAFVGAGSGSCAAQPVCCWWGAEYAYLVAIDCVPIDLNQ